MSVVVVVVICASCANHSFSKVVSLEKNFSLNARIVFWHLNMDYITFLNVILKDLSKLSVSFTIQTQL